uniref:Uncharacterized protein n=1 Tax=Oryza meridionalis TaxID=40149 RepID=A0A0E0CKD7_9ORYZ
MVDLVLNHRGVIPTREELISLSATLTVCYSNPSTAPATSSPHRIYCRRCLFPPFQAMASTAFLNATPHHCQCSFLEGIQSNAQLRLKPQLNRAMIGY